jgi:hypothetical protein
MDFTTDVGAFSTFLGTVEATGGDDAAEDIAGALNLACGLLWSSATRLIFHMRTALVTAGNFMIWLTVSSTTAILTETLLPFALS